MATSDETPEAENQELQAKVAQRKAELLRFLQEEVWPKVSPETLSKGLSQREQAEILGYGENGV